MIVGTGVWVAQEGLRNPDTKLVVINRDPTQVDAYADLRIEGGASQILTAVAEKLGVEV